MLFFPFLAASIADRGQQQQQQQQLQQLGVNPLLFPFLSFPLLCFSSSVLFLLRGVHIQQNPKLINFPAPHPLHARRRAHICAPVYLYNPQVSK